MNLLRTVWLHFLNYVNNERGDIGQMFTAPKSKSPWEAMTRGSSGEWANFMAPGESFGFVGPLMTMAAGLIPYVGPYLSAGMGAAGMMGGEGSWLGDTGYQGSDYGGGNLMPTLMGGLAGYGAGSVGSGISSGMSQGMSNMGAAGMPGVPGVGSQTGNFMGGFGQGFNQGMNSFGVNKMLFGAGGGGTAAAKGAGVGGAWLGGGGGAATSGAASGLLGGGGLMANAGNLLGPAMALGGAAGMFGAEQPEFNMKSPTDFYEEARSTVLGKYLGEGALPGFSQRAQEEYLGIINTPFGELYEKWDQGGAMKDELDRALTMTYDKYDEQINQSFAQAGGIGSDDHRKALSESTRLRGEEMRIGLQQMQQEQFSEAVKIKQGALIQGMQQGQYNESLAMQLAQLMGQDQQLQMAFESNDYNNFQEIMGKIMMMGIQTQLPQSPSLNMGG